MFQNGTLTNQSGRKVFWIWGACFGLIGKILSPTSRLTVFPFRLLHVPNQSKFRDLAGFMKKKSRSGTSRQGAGFTPNLAISYPKCGWFSSGQNLISTLWRGSTRIWNLNFSIKVRISLLTWWWISCKKKRKVDGLRVVHQIMGFTPILVNSSRLYNTSDSEF